MCYLDPTLLHRTPDLPNICLIIPPLSSFRRECTFGNLLIVINEKYRKLIIFTIYVRKEYHVSNRQHATKLLFE